MYLSALQRQLNIKGYQCSTNLEFVLFKHNVKSVSDVTFFSLSLQCIRNGNGTRFHPNPDAPNGKPQTVAFLNHNLSIYLGIIDCSFSPSLVFIPFTGYKPRTPQALNGIYNEIDKVIYFSVTRSFEFIYYLSVFCFVIFNFLPLPLVWLPFLALPRYIFGMYTFN